MNNNIDIELYNMIYLLTSSLDYIKFLFLSTKINLVHTYLECDIAYAGISYMSYGHTTYL